MDDVVEESGQQGRRPRLALWGVLAVLVLGGGALVVRSGSDRHPPQLPLSLGSSGGAGAEKLAAPTAGATTDMVRWVVYKAGDDLPALGGSGPAYRLSGTVTKDQVRDLARALGLEGEPTHQDGSWSVDTDKGTLEVSESGGGTWWYSSGDQMRMQDDGRNSSSSSGGGSTGSSAGSSGSGGEAVDPVPPVVDAPTDPATTDPAKPDPGVTEPACTPEAAGAVAELCPEVDPDPYVPPADLPSKASARATGLDLLAYLDVDVEHADVTVDGPYDAWYVGVQPQVDGLDASGFSFSVEVGPKGVVQSASGVLARPERLGDYPVLDTKAAIDRLNEGFGPMALDDVAPADAATTEVAPAPVLPADEPAGAPTPTLCETPTPAPDGAVTQEACIGPAEDPVPVEPQELVLHHAERILVVIYASDDSGDAYLVPGYRFTGDEDALVEVPSVDDAALLPTPTTVPTKERPEAPVAPAVGDGESSH